MSTAMGSGFAPEALLAGITEGYCALDEAGRMTYVNAAAAAIAGATPQKLLGKTVWEIWPEGVGSRLWDAIGRVGQNGTGEDFILRSRSRGTWYAVRVSRISGGLAVYLHDVTAQKRAEEALARLAAGHAAVRRVAEAVATGAPQETVHELAAREAGILLAAHVSLLVAFGEDARDLRALASWREGHPPPFARGERVGLSRNSLLRAVRASGEARLDDDVEPDPATTWGRIGCRSEVVVPIRAGGGLWGAVALGWLERRPDPEIVRKLTDFTRLVALAVDNASVRARLAEQASSDPLTGLLNHRAFHERLRDEVDRARRYDRPLALTLLDLDSFKPINDSQGHQAGDALLRAIAQSLRAAVRSQDVVARIGGDEFALLMPETSGEAALAAIENLREQVGGIEVGGQGVTTSAGICDLVHAADADELYRLADGALYWSKEHGRDTACLYAPDVVRELSAKERADALSRSQALAGLRALARAIDAKDPSTRRHASRVADIAQLLAEELGWHRERVGRLREAALVHDVGKIGVPDAILLKPARLTQAEYEVVKRHADLGAQIVDEILLPEQVAWVHAHHERPDGRGYPRRLAAEAIPSGAAILAVADAYDVMTSARPYSWRKPSAEAVSEVCDLGGTQFDAEVTNALFALHARGALA